jgi:predicted CxxxxCH...CXXCH cytochrome family protein
MSVERRALRWGAAALAVLLWACLSLRDEARQERNACASCHGSGDRAADALQQAAPPRDLMGNVSPDYPGVGAHQAHLGPSATHGGIACTECHAVPEASDTPGHADSALPAEVQFGALARRGDAAPRYDSVARRCADTYCHGALSPLWTEPASERCGGCHGLPPPAPQPQYERCDACHGAVVDGEQQIVDPTSHVEGRVDVGAIACEACHGSAASAAPPPSLDGSTRGDQRGVGAHPAHLAGGTQSRPLACSECHSVPEATHPFLHPDGSLASVVFTGAARAGERAPAWDATTGACSDSWCHGPSGGPGAAVSWIHGAPLGCVECHGLPPASPHPQVQDCGLCHADVYSSAGAAIVQRDRHVDGVVDVRVPAACTGCHSSGGADAGLSGLLPSAAPDIGAHRVHLTPRGPARPVRCEECHAVPSDVFSPGHVDTALPAEVAFSGVATAFEARPVFDAGSCVQTYCHGDQFIGGRPSGGVDTRPSWVLPGDVSALTCQSCHGLPPPAPHPQAADDCSSCHRNVDDNRLFIAAATHVDGVVTFFLP